MESMRLVDTMLWCKHCTGDSQEEKPTNGGTANTKFNFNPLVSVLKWLECTRDKCFWL